MSKLPLNADPFRRLVEAVQDYAVFLLDPKGVIDPTKVVRFALQNASSVAGLMLTTDAMVAELVEEKKGGGGHSHGGMPDMGGMGGMDM